MKSRFPTLNSALLRIFSFGGLALVVLLFATMLTGRGTAKPNYTQNVGATPPPPIESVQPTIGIPTAVVATVQPTPSRLVPEEVLERNYGTWSYKAGRHHSAGTSVIINSDFSTVAELHAFATANQLLATDLATRGGQAEVYVTFRTYLTPQQFRTWVISKGATVDYTELRTVWPDGSMGTTGIGKLPGETEPLPQQHLDRSLTLGGGPGQYTLTVRGVYHTVIKVDAARLPEVAADPLVFLANVTPNIVRNDLLAAGWQLQPRSLQVDPPTPFWKMEQLGLENFTR